MVDTWQPSKGVLFFFLSLVQKSSEGFFERGTRRFFEVRQLGFFLGEAASIFFGSRQLAFFLGAGN